MRQDLRFHRAQIEKINRAGDEAALFHVPGTAMWSVTKTLPV